jgi:ABC-type phosphate transport system substrate-binding protein
MDFNSRGEARDFSYILNSLYYEKSGTSEASKLKGLVNLKTNIELLTSQGAASMTSTSSFDTPDSATLSSASTAQNILALDITNGSPAYDSFIIDYSVNFAGVSSNYQRIGTLYVTGYNNSGGTTDVSISDRSSEVTDLSGTIQFSATISGNTITVTGTHTIGQSLKFNYLTRRWNSR